jgi:hypothetical protein
MCVKALRSSDIIESNWMWLEKNECERYCSIPSLGGGRKQEERKRGRSVFVYAVLGALGALASSSMPSLITGMTMNFTN